MGPAYPTPPAISPDCCFGRQASASKASITGRACGAPPLAVAMPSADTFTVVVLRHDSDLPDDGVIERRQFRGGNPELAMSMAADLVGLIASDELRLDVELRDVPNEVMTVVLRIPVPRDLLGVLEVQDRVEDRLLRQPRRKGPTPGLLDQPQLREANRSP
jgi:hypothetical protein